jgi:hypothetical protein
MLNERGTDHAPSLNVSFVVEDSGVGIAKADQQRIFGAFQQASWTGTNALEGTGLGLSIARELALRMGGDITCKSELGHGSRFTFTARMKLVDPPQEADRRSEFSLVHEDSAMQSRGYRVLLAEDNDVNAIIATAFITNSGMACERVETGDAAVRQAVRMTDRPTLVLMDCLMPRLDGYAGNSANSGARTTAGTSAHSGNCVDRSVRRIRSQGLLRRRNGRRPRQTVFGGRFVQDCQALAA